MREEKLVGETVCDTLAMQALLYASGELDEAQVAAFEQRLGEDQSVREALCQAVQMTLALQGQVLARPHPAYRERVRQRLRARPPWWQVLVGKRAYRGHPAVWSGMGAAAAVLLMIGLGQFPHLDAVPRSSTPIAVQPPPADEPAIADIGVAVATLEEANTWAELKNSDHLEKARSEEVRRKNRAQELRDLVKNKSDDRRNRVLGKPSARP